MKPAPPVTRVFTAPNDSPENSTSFVPVALNDAKAVPPRSSSSLSAEASVTSAVTGPMRTRTRLPTRTTEAISPRIRFSAESSTCTRPTETSHG